MCGCTVENDVLAISGERKFEKRGKGEKVSPGRTAYGSFVRSFSIPEDADLAARTADFKEGMLQVHLRNPRRRNRKRSRSRGLVLR